MNITGLSMIAGEFAKPSGRTFHSTNPRTREPLAATFHCATADDIDQAVKAAVDAFRETRTYPASKIADFLDAAAEEIEALGDVLVQTVDSETGLGMARLAGERNRTTLQLRAFAALLREGSYVEAIVDHALPDRQPAPRPDIRRMLFPIGPVAVFGASNFPLAFSVAGGDTASAFAAGCPVVVKAHRSHPATAELVALALTRAVRRSGFPAGFFSLIQANDTQIGQALVKHPGIMAVGFTGSHGGGRALFDAANQRPKPIPVYAEMGSINPVVILPDALKVRLDAIADGLVNSITLGTGQFCTSPGLVFMIEGEHTEQFVRVVNQKMSDKPSGTLLNATIERSLEAAVTHTVSRSGVTVAAQGTKTLDVGYTFPNTVLATDSSNFLADEALQAEHFGPVSLFVRCKSTDDLLAAIERLDGNLTATVHTEPGETDVATAVCAALREKVGRVIINGYPTGVEVVHAMHHGGPYPATTFPSATSVGMTAIKRFMRPVAFQNMPDALLPDALKAGNPLGIWRIVDNTYTRV